MKSLFFSIFLLSFVYNGCLTAQVSSSFFDEADAFFGTYVTNGKVDYASLSKNSEPLDRLLALAKTSTVTTEDPKNYQAFWINTYNLAVIKGVLEAYPIASPLDVSGFFETKKYELAGSSITLNDIENKKLRAKFHEPRFHFVLVCGAEGCPPIIPEAYRPATLETLLQQQTVKALNNDSFIKVKQSTVALSEIFKWYKEDFVKGQTEIEFINKFRREKIPTNLKVSYYSYNWNLNGK
ncbi:DUF547 domain-containing protein [Altibacter sp.]|uniref:DUF547 domain-containing protein n=1 Tax=Altibacter sp. TaxID=2024823 RepID=UPI000C98A221|nr:DUF547 domain-containing protein [Altibacter sp.]MAP55306.1 DUF547 domain-containing protein [Altibacter sp.]